MISTPHATGEGSTTTPTRPTVLLVLLGLAAFLSVFDQVITVSSLPLMRNPAALATALAVGLYVWYRRDGLPLTQGTQRWAIAFLLFTAFLELLRYIWSGDPQWFRYLQWAQVLVLAIVTMDAARDRRSFAMVGGAIVAAVIFMAIATVLRIPGFSGDSEGRFGFDGVNLNTQGYWYAMAAATMFWWLLRRWPRFGWAGAAALLGIGTLGLALIQTGSRSSFVALVVGVAIVLALSLRAKNLSAYATVVPAALLLLGFFIADATVLRERFLDTLTQGDVGIRDSLTEHGLALVADAPWFGHGPSFLFLLGEARGMSRPISSHNSYLQVALNFGLPATLLWLGIIVSAMGSAWRSYAYRRDGLGSLMLSLIAMSMVFGLAGDLGFNKFFWMMIALASQAPQAIPAHPRAATNDPPPPTHRYETSVRPVAPVAGRAPGLASGRLDAPPRGPS